MVEHLRAVDEVRTRGLRVGNATLHQLSYYHLIGAFVEPNPSP